MFCYGIFLWPFYIWAGLRLFWVCINNLDSYFLFMFFNVSGVSLYCRIPAGFLPRPHSCSPQEMLWWARLRSTLFGGWEQLFELFVGGFSKRFLDKLFKLFRNCDVAPKSSPGSIFGRTIAESTQKALESLKTQPELLETPTYVKFRIKLQIGNPGKLV